VENADQEDRSNKKFGLGLLAGDAHILPLKKIGSPIFSLKSD
jgi:hypothetical protein